MSFVPASHENPNTPGVLKKVLFYRPDFIEGHVQMVNWALLPVGSSFQNHYHDTMQEVFVLVSGRVRMTVNGETVEMVRGDAVIVEKKEQHTMENLGDSDAEYVVFGISQGETGKTVVV